MIGRSSDGRWGTESPLGRAGDARVSRRNDDPSGIRSWTARGASSRLIEESDVGDRLILPHLRRRRHERRPHLRRRATPTAPLAAGAALPPGSQRQDARRPPPQTPTTWPRRRSSSRPRSGWARPWMPGWIITRRWLGLSNSFNDASPIGSLAAGGAGPCRHLRGLPGGGGPAGTGVREHLLYGERMQNQSRAPDRCRRALGTGGGGVTGYLRERETGAAWRAADASEM